MDVVDVWTGRHANALRTALRLTNEAFAQQLGTAVRTVAKWNAEPELIPMPELQRVLDTALARADETVRRRFGLLLASPTADDAADKAERRLADDAGVSQRLTWLDEHAGWPVGTARRRVAALLGGIDMRQVRDQAHTRGQVGRADIARHLADYYGLPVDGYAAYRAACDGVPVETSVLTRADWLDLGVILGGPGERLAFDPSALPPQPVLDEFSADAAARRIAVGVASDTRMANASLYRLLDIEAAADRLHGTFGLTDFLTYALTLDLLENETIDAIAAGTPARDSMPLRSRYLPDLGTVLDLPNRVCAGGPLALFVAARPAGRSREPDYVLLVQERSGRVLNSASRLAVIPKSFHEPMVDITEDTAISLTLERELEEELFGRPEVDSTISGSKHADPMHHSRLSEPMRWLAERRHPDIWRMECTGFGLNLVSGNFEFASLIVIHDEDWWGQYGGHVEANWESDGLRRYSTRDRELIARLVHDATWSNEGLFALMQGLRRLAQLDPGRVDVPHIEWEL